MGSMGGHDKIEGTDNGQGIVANVLSAKIPINYISRETVSRKIVGGLPV